MIRKIRLRNPLSTGAKVALGLAGLAAGGAVLYATTREEEAAPKKKYGELPPPPETAGAPSPCDFGPRYPNFVQNRAGVCVPGNETPGGIYVFPDCTDFAFAPARGPRRQDPQTQNMNAMLTAATAAQESVDPVLLTTNFLKAFWPECAWPPAPDAPARIVQLFMALAFQLGRRIWNAGGVVLDASDADQVDESVAAKLAEAGLENFEPEVVPEVVLPMLVSRGVVGVPTPMPPAPKEGVSGVPLPPPACLDPKDDQGTKALPAANWQERKIESVTLLAQPPDSPCKIYKLLLGACVRTNANASYGGLDNIVNGVVLAPAGGVKMNAGFGQPPLGQFKLPHVFKRIYEVTVTFHEGAPPTIQVKSAVSQGIDPCVDLNNFWPEDGGGAIAVQNENGDWKEWIPAPKFKIAQSGNVIIRLQVEYSGLPYFIKKGEEMVAQVGGLAPGSQFEFSYKVRSKGEV